MKSNYINEYYGKILSGEIAAGEYIREIYGIICAKIASGEYVFDVKRAEKTVRFIENYCRLSKGSNGLIKLELWQKATLSCIFALLDRNGLRVYREVFIIIGKKNGKSTLAAAIIAYIAFLDGEYGNEIYCLATKKDQADIVIDRFTSMIKQDDELSVKAKISSKNIYIEESNTVIASLPATPESLDGPDPNLIICDEIAAWEGEKGLRMYELIKKSFVSRREPLLISITHAGYVNDGIYDELVKRGTSVLKGHSRESSFLPLMYVIDDAEKWDDPEELKKSNPNMGVSVLTRNIREDINTAYGSEPAKKEFIIKTCNIKQSPITAWLDYETVTSARCDAKLEDFRKCHCLGGVDLSQTTDLTAASTLIEKAGIIFAFVKFFIPESKLATIRREFTHFDKQLELGNVMISGKNCVEYTDITKWYCGLRDKYSLYYKYIGYDRNSANYFAQELKSNGFLMYDVWQGYILHPVLMEFETLLKDGKLKLCNNGLLEMNIHNVALKADYDSRRFKPVKISQTARIDGAMSVIDALAVRQKMWDEIKFIIKN